MRVKKCYSKLSNEVLPKNVVAKKSFMDDPNIFSSLFFLSIAAAAFELVTCRIMFFDGLRRWRESILHTFKTPFCLSNYNFFHLELRAPPLTPNFNVACELHVRLSVRMDFGHPPPSWKKYCMARTSLAVTTVRTHMQHWDWGAGGSRIFQPCPTELSQKSMS